MLGTTRSRTRVTREALPAPAGLGDDGRMAFFGDGLATGSDLRAAARRAVDRAVEPLGAEPDLLAVFVSGPDADEIGDLAPLLASRSGAKHVVGCSASGVLGAGRGVRGEPTEPPVPAISVWAAVLPEVQLRVFHLEVMRTESGLAVVGMPDRQADEQVGLLLADPYSFPLDSFVTRSNEALPGLSLLGGMAAGASGPGSTRLFLDGRAVDRGAVGVLFRGGELRTMVSQGCRPIGLDMVVTKADGNVLLELAGLPALTKVREAMAGLTTDEQEQFRAGPQIGIAMDEYAEDRVHGDFVVRPVLGIDEARQAVSVGEVVEVGRTVRFHLRDATAARADLLGQLAKIGPAGGALVTSCVGRGMELFGNDDVDAMSIRTVLGASGVAGFFGGGELGPVHGRNYLHGLTASVLAFP
jgi:small ligand-binding sensory domain FIST